jgi:hypothetical protein
MSSAIDLAATYDFYPLMNIEGNRSAAADEILCSCIQKLQQAFVPPVLPFDWVGAVKYEFQDIKQLGLPYKGRIVFNPRFLTEWTTVHELAHAWDAANNWLISDIMRKETHSLFLFPWLHKMFPEKKLFWYRVGSPPAPCGVGKNFTAKEDFAESVTAYLFPEEAHRRASKRGFSYELNGYIHFHDTPRGKFIYSLFRNG